MRILVTAAGRHGGTVAIAKAIADRLREHDFDVSTARLDEVTRVDDLDAAVIGSAIYMGRWVKEARDSVTERAGELKRIRVWLFSSGPIDGVPEGEGKDGPELASLIDARSHRVFGGRLLREDLSLRERAITGIVRSAEGDFRDWDEITAWADEIAAALIPAPI